MLLKPQTFLQGGKYKITRVLGQGGFGITYEAKQVALNRKVAIKEFFMKEYCERDETTSHVKLGTSSGSRELVERFRVKFVKEARTIAALNHPNIVKIIDVFEENGTAYYVMQYVDGGSLADLCKDNHRLPEMEAMYYTRQIALALDYLHHRSEPMNHLDIKPSNVLLDENGNAVLIDFGISKRYDEKGGQTSSTPVGISHGYSPLEQYKDGGVKEFSPATDIYSLGATLYKLTTGKTPPQASDILESGLPATPGLSSVIRNAIVAAMQPRRGDRPQNISEFLGLLIKEHEEKEEDEETIILSPKVKNSTNQRKDNDTKDNKNKDLWPWVIIAGLVAVITASLIIWGRYSDNRNTPMKPLETAPSTIKSNTTGSIKLISYPPGAAVYLDGQQTNRITPTEISNVAPGYHTVVLKKSGFEDYSVSIDVSASKNVTTSCVLKDVSSFISTSSNNDSNAAINSAASNTENKEMGLSKDRLVLKAGESYTLSAYHYGSYVSWNTEDPKVATVSKKGKVTAVAPGRTLIWALGSNKKVAGCFVEVSE